MQDVHSILVRRPIVGFQLIVGLCQWPQLSLGVPQLSGRRAPPAASGGSQAIFSELSEVRVLLWMVGGQGGADGCLLASLGRL